MRNSRSMRRDKLLAKFLYGFAHDVVGVSSGVADDLSSWAGVPREKISVIHNPIVRRSMSDRDFPVPDHPFFRACNKPLILSAGRFVEAKDFSTLIRAFARVHETREARLLILGDGERREHLEQLVSDLGISSAVSLPGYTTDPYPYMAHADVFALASRYEGFGNVLVESLAMGTPVVSTDCPTGPAEILQNGKYGTLVPVNDQEAMAEAITATLEGTTDSKRLQERALAFSIESVTREYEKLLCVD